MKYDVKAHALTLGFAALATLALSFNWFGFGLGGELSSTAQQQTADAVNAEVVKLYTPECVRNFENQANMPVQWAAYKKSGDWEHDSYLKDHGFATPTGAKAPNEAVATACASKLDNVLTTLAHPKLTKS